MFAAAAANAAKYETENTAASNILGFKAPEFLVKSLKYEPYPVNAGEWFDIWIKVENIGENDASDARFELLLQYPFTSSENLTQDYGTIFGKKNASLSKRPEEQKNQDNLVVLKYRIRVADNAPEGVHILKLNEVTDRRSVYQHTYDIPVEVGKTKTKFDIVMQDSASKKTTFVVANIGEKSASGIIVSVLDKDNTLVNGPKSVIIGNLEPGDFTSASFPIVPSKFVSTIPMEVSYTDTAGVRNVYDVNVTVKLGVDAPVNSNPSLNAKAFTNEINWIVGLVGGVLGIILASIVYAVIRKKKGK